MLPRKYGQYSASIFFGVGAAFSRLYGRGDSSISPTVKGFSHDAPNRSAAATPKENVGKECGDDSWGEIVGNGLREARSCLTILSLLPCPSSGASSSRAATTTALSG